MPFQPGQSGNPSGRSAARPWADAIRRALARSEAEGNGRALNDLADKLLAKAAEGDLMAIKELGDRLDGKPAQAIIGGDADDPPIRAKVDIEFVGEAPARVRVPLVG